MNTDPKTIFVHIEKEIWGKKKKSRIPDELETQWEFGSSPRCKVAWTTLLFLVREGYGKIIGLEGSFKKCLSFLLIPLLQMKFPRRMVSCSFKMICYWWVWQHAMANELSEENCSYNHFQILKNIQKPLLLKNCYSIG